MNEAVNSDKAASPDIPVPAPANRVAESREAASDQPDANDTSGYRLAGPEPFSTQRDSSAAPELEEEIPASEVEIPKPVVDTTFQAATEAKDESSTETFPDPPPDVRDVWTRWVDWKEPLLWTSAGVALATSIVFAPASVATISFVAAITYGSYRVITSLEVPVRVTPEQAIQEFFSAANHRLPNFHRMYGLLTAEGKQCDAFRNLSEFRTYWRGRIKEFVSSPTWIVPLEFRIEGFKCRYNAEKSMASVRYVVKVAPRGRPESAAPAAEFDMRNLVVKGSDGQWYVNDGTLH